MEQQIVSKEQMEHISNSIKKCADNLQAALQESVQVHANLTSMHLGIADFIVNKFPIPADQVHQGFSEVQTQSIEPEVIQVPPITESAPIVKNSLVHGVLQQLFKENPLLVFLQKENLHDLVKYVEYTKWLHTKDATRANTVRTELVLMSNTKSNFAFFIRLNKLLLTFTFDYNVIATSPPEQSLLPINFATISSINDADHITNINLDDVQASTLFELHTAFITEFTHWYHADYLEAKRIIDQPGLMQAVIDTEQNLVMRGHVPTNAVKSIAENVAVLKEITAQQNSGEMLDKVFTDFDKSVERSAIINGFTL